MSAASRKKKKDARSPQARNPADVSAGIDASKIGMSSKAQRTATSEEKKTFKKTGFSPAQERSLRATGKGRGEFTGPLQDSGSRLEQGQIIEPTGTPTPEEIRAGVKDVKFFDFGNLMKTLPYTLPALMPAGATGSFLKNAGTGVRALLSRAAAGQVTKKAVTTTAGRITPNTVNAAKTTSWLTKLARTAKNPTFVASTILSTVGSYPFAGFIKEEALQTLSFATASAIKSGDIEGAEQAIQQTAEVLDPEMWTEILASIPYANILTQLNAFYEAATTKLDVDAKNIETMKAKQQETEQTNKENLEQQQSQGFTLSEEQKARLNQK